MRFIGGKMNVTTTGCHVWNPNWAIRSVIDGNGDAVVSFKGVEKDELFVNPVESILEILILISRRKKKNRKFGIR